MLFRSIALLGGGTVGSAFYNLVLERAEELSAFGVVPRFLGVLVRDPRKPRAIPQELLRAEPFDLLEADLVVEAMGGVEAPLRLVLPALEAGIPLITANKALLAEAWESLRPFAEEGLIYHEASVMAGTPALSFLETLRGSELLELHGILNGTTLYILQEMEKGRTYAEALLEAQRLGYAEALLREGAYGEALAQTVALPPLLDPGLKAQAKATEVLALLALGEEEAAWQKLVEAKQSGLPEPFRLQLGRAVGRAHPGRRPPAPHPPRPPRGLGPPPGQSRLNH